MKYKNLEITIEGNTEERPFGLTHPIQKRKDQCGLSISEITEETFSNQPYSTKTFNKSTVNISYSCMKNINSIISSHNKNILNPRTMSFGCNCRKK